MSLGHLCPSVDLGSGPCEPGQGYHGGKCHQKFTAEIRLTKGIVSPKVDSQEGSCGIAVLRGEGQLQHHWEKGNCSIIGQSTLQMDPH